jgi:chromosome segregation ATPase
VDSGSSSAPPSVRTADVAAAPALPPSDAEGNPNGGGCEIAAALEAASAAEAAAKLEEVAARALVRERALLSQVSTLREEVAAAQRYPIVISRLTRDLELAQADCVRLVERKASECEAVLKRQEAELVALQAHVDARDIEVERLQAQLAPVEESLARYRAAAVEAALPTAPESDPDADQTSPDSARRDRRSGDTAHLEAVVEALHSENRANAVRLVEFARTVERQAARIRELETRGDALERRVDESPFLTDGVKEQLLTGTRLQGQRSHFRQRMMERFGALVGEDGSDGDGEA